MCTDNLPNFLPVARPWCMVFIFSIAQAGVCSADGKCHAYVEAMDDAYDDDGLNLLQRRAFLERPPLAIEDGIQVELHAVSELQTQPNPGLPALSKLPDAKEDPVAPTGEHVEAGHGPVADSELESKDQGAQRAQASHSPVDALRSDPVQDDGSTRASAASHARTSSDAAEAAAKHAISQRVSLMSAIIQMNATENGSLANETENSSKYLLNRVRDEEEIVKERLEATQAVSTVEMKTLATLIFEGIVLFIAECFRRLWIAGAVEMSADARLAVLSFPVVFWLFHRCRGYGRKNGASSSESCHFEAVANVRKVPSVEPTETEGPEQLFDSVGCALERTGHLETGETVTFRSLAINASGLAYSALGRPTSAGRWRLELLDSFLQAQSPDSAPVLDAVLVGIMNELDVASAADELAGHWAFVSASRGRGFAYSPAGRAIRRGVETPCAHVVDPRKEALELILDAPRRSFEVFRVSDAGERELLCSFEGIRTGRYHLAVSLRTGSLKVLELRPEERKGDAITA
jgi:hypothetical protein